MSDSATNCPMCGDITEPSGALGQRLHYRCQACGWWWSALNDNAEDSGDEAQP